MICVTQTELYSIIFVINFYQFPVFILSHVIDKQGHPVRLV